jgi:hypothetical protein
MKDIFADDGHRFPNVVPHFVLVSPGPPKQPIPWADWMMRPGISEPFYLPLPQPADQKMVITRGKVGSKVWQINPAWWPGSK